MRDADRRSSCRSRSERGTALLLFPAAVMVLMVLAAIAVDLTSIHLARRELYRTASQAADDAAAMIDHHSLRAGDLRTIDLGAATRLVRSELAAAKLPGAVVDGPRVRLGPRPGTVEVTLTISVEHFFAKAIPGAGESERITVDVVGELLDD